MKREKKRKVSENHFLYFALLWDRGMVSCECLKKTYSREKVIFFLDNN